ncbi:MAG: ATP synthase F1 subunit delta [Gemmatimonadetes bacterium RIFCSPLOWO2_02_FULL_71_11]|nr:MAG: ATP synthase F1 subunit delta [Gemmatimonadetes bacterium RIFCSPLOWO2_02_FULL_71_11]
MKNPVVARNYAAALVAVAERHDQVEQYGLLLDALAGAVGVEPKIKQVLESPRVHKAAKKRILEQALKGVAPAPLVRFLQAVVQRGRQGMLADISAAYQDLVDRHLGRVHAGVTTARPVDEALRAAITERLTAAIGKTVVPHFRTEASVIGGVIVRVGDRVFDGSLRRRIRLLRHRMLHAPGGGSA